jgi:hypothetical protein
MSNKNTPLPRLSTQWDNGYKSAANIAAQDQRFVQRVFIGMIRFYRKEQWKRAATE